jgi:ribosome-associated protein
LIISDADELALDGREIEEVFIRAGGHGGQNVDKVATAVQLSFDVAHSPSLNEATRERIARLIAGRRMTGEGVLVVMVQRFRNGTARSRRRYPDSSILSVARLSRTNEFRPPHPANVVGKQSLPAVASSICEQQVDKGQSRPA